MYAQCRFMMKFCTLDRISKVTANSHNYRKQIWGELFLPLTLKAPITTAADDIHKYMFNSEKIRLDISCESSARQRIHIKHQALFFSIDKSKKK